MSALSPAEWAAWVEWSEAERDLDGKYKAHEQARERRDIAIAKLRKFALERKQ